MTIERGRRPQVGSKLPAPTRRAPLLAAVILVASTLSGCQFGFDREEMLGQVVDTVILPGNDSLTVAASALDESAREFAQNPSDETLEALRTSWLAAAIAWKRVEMFQFPGLLLIHNAIETRPARVPFIEGLIAPGDSAAAPVLLDAAAIEPLGSTSKGLGAIEYLIYESPLHAEPILEAFADPARGSLLTALTGNLVAKTEELSRFWTAEGENYGLTFRENDSEGADIQGSVSLLANRLIETYEMTMQRKFGMPMGRTTDGVPDPETVESPATGRSLELLTANLESALRTFDAGLDDYVTYVSGRRALSQGIHSQFASVFYSLEVIEGSLEDAVVEDQAAVAAAYEAMRPLLVLLKTDMAAQLGITVTFSDADGD